MKWAMNEWSYLWKQVLQSVIQIWTKKVGTLKSLKKNSWLSFLLVENFDYIWKEREKGITKILLSCTDLIPVESIMKEMKIPCPIQQKYRLQEDHLYVPDIVHLLGIWYFGEQYESEENKYIPVIIQPCWMVGFLKQFTKMRAKKLTFGPPKKSSTSMCYIFF